MNKVIPVTPKQMKSEKFYKMNWMSFCYVEENYINWEPFVYVVLNNRGFYFLDSEVDNEFFKDLSRHKAEQVISKIFGMRKYKF